MHFAKGQVIVELAVTLPFLMFLILGSIEAGFLLIAKAHQDRLTSVVAEYAADHDDDSWHSVANAELNGCDVSVTVTQPHRLTEATVRCLYQPVVFRVFSGIPMTSHETAISRQSPDVEATPAASPS